MLRMIIFEEILSLEKKVEVLEKEKIGKKVYFLEI